MLKPYFVLLFLMGLTLFSITGLSQNRLLDSLKKNLQNARTDSQRLKALIELGDKSSYFSPTESIKYLREAQKMAIRSGSEEALGEVYACLGTTYFYMDQLDTAVFYFQKGISVFEKDKSPDAKTTVSIIQANLADVLQQKGKYQEAIKTYLESIDILKRYQPDHHNGIGNTLLAIAGVYKDMGQYHKSLTYASQAIDELKKDTGNPTALAFGQLFAVGDLIFLSRLEEAEAYLMSTKEIADEVNSSSLNAQMHGNWGALYDKKGELDKSIESYAKALQYSVAAGAKHSEISALVQLGLINLDPKIYNVSSASSFLKRALALVRQQEDKYREVLVLRGLAKAEAGLQNFREAVKYYEEFTQLNDSLNSADVKRKINEIENKYQSEKKQLAIDALQKDNQVQKLEIKRKSTLNIALVAGFILLFLVAALSYINFKNKNRLLSQQEDLHKQRINELENERKIVAMQSVLKGQEEERTRLARDLHDGVGGMLSGVKLSMSVMKGNFYLSQENAKAFNQIITQLDHSIAELRTVSHNMMPEALIKYGLVEAIGNYCDYLNSSGKLKVKFQTYGMQERLEQNNEITIYRIIQELLNNVIKHANAQTVLVQLSRENNRFSLTVEDDGNGMQMDQKTAGAGLANIKARAETMNGSVDIVSKKGEGTSINIEGDCL